MIYSALLFAHPMCTHHSLCALLPTHFISAPTLSLLPTIMQHGSSQTASLLSSLLSESWYFAAVTLFFCCHTAMPLSYNSSVVNCLAIVMLFCHCHATPSLLYGFACHAVLHSMLLGHFHAAWHCCDILPVLARRLGGFGGFEQTSPFTEKGLLVAKKVCFLQ